MNSNGAPAIDAIAEASVGTDGDSRTCARATVLGTVDDVAVRSSGKAGLESRAPALITVVDDHESGVAPSESDLLGGRGGPVGDVRSLDGVPETNHSGDGSPAVLAIPAVRSRAPATCTRVSVGSTGIAVTELIA